MGMGARRRSSIQGFRELLAYWKYEVLPISDLPGKTHHRHGTFVQYYLDILRRSYVGNRQPLMQSHEDHYYNIWLTPVDIGFL